MRRTHPVRIGDLLSDFTASPGVSRKLAEARLPEAWRKVTGPVVSRVTTGMEFCRGVFYVHLVSGAVRNEIFMQREALRCALNREVGMEVVRVLIIK